MPPKGKKENNKDLKGKCRRGRKSKSKSDGEHSIPEGDSKDKEVAVTPRKKRKGAEKNSDKSNESLDKSFVEETNDSLTLDIPGQVLDRESNKGAVSVVNPIQGHEQRSDILEPVPGTSQERGKTSQVGEEEELDYEEEPMDNDSPTAENSAEEADSDSSINPLKGHHQSSSSGSDAQARRKRKVKKNERKNKKRRQRKQKKRWRYPSSSSSSSTSSSSSSSSSSEEEVDHKPKGHRHSQNRSRCREKLEEQVVMSKQTFLDMKTLYDKMEKFYQDHQQNEVKQAGERNENGSNSKKTREGDILTAIPGLNHESFRQKKQVPEAISETMIHPQQVN